MTDEENTTEKDHLRYGLGCLLQGLAVALVLIAWGLAGALVEGRIP